MVDKKRITAWCSKTDLKWLKGEKQRIENSTNGANLCEIKEHTLKSHDGSEVTKYALFYSNGYYDKCDGAHMSWVRDK